MSDVLLGLGRSREQREAGGWPPRAVGRLFPFLSDRGAGSQGSRLVWSSDPWRPPPLESPRSPSVRSQSRGTCRAAVSPQRAISTHSQSGSAWPWFSLAPPEGLSAFLSRAPRPALRGVSYRIPASWRLHALSLPSALLGVGTRLSPWSSCLSMSPHGHVLTSRAGRRSAPRLAPARPRTAPVLLGAAFPGLRHRHRPHVRASRFALAVFLIATEYRHVEAAAPQFGAFRQVSGLETPVLPRGLYGGGGGRAPGHGPCRFHTSAGRLTASHSTRACCVAGREGGSGVLWGAPLCSLPCSEVTELPDQSSVSLQNSFELFGPVHLKTIKDFP